LNCSICKNGRLVAGFTTVTLERATTVVILREVPALVCQECAEYYLDDATAERVYARAEDAVARNVEVEIVRFAA
jgi:YgiT-type zinc finger domain-containing protein